MTADSGVGLFPLVGEFCGDGSEDGFCFPTEATVGRHDEGGKVSALGLAGFEILALFALLVLAEDRISGLIALAGGIEVSDADICDAVSTAGEEAAEEAVAPFERAGVGWSISGGGVGDSGCASG